MDIYRVVDLACYTVKPTHFNRDRIKDIYPTANHKIKKGEKREREREGKGEREKEPSKLERDRERVGSKLF